MLKTLTQSMMAGRPANCRNPIQSALNAVLFLIQRRRQHNALGALDERMLRDVGISAEDARRVAAKPFWWF
jgi:uncharacterized protein YjiS (DUF1127 family)